MLEEVVGRQVDRDVEALVQGQGMDHLLHLDKLLPEVLVDVDHNGFVEVLLSPPVIVEGGDVDPHLPGDHPGRRAVKTVLTENSAGDVEDAGLHRLGVFAGFFEGGGHRRLPACDSII